jgi:hypothetical protein
MDLKTRNQNYPAGNPTIAVNKAFLIPVVQAGASDMRGQTERYKQRLPKRARCSGALILQPKAKWVNSPNRRTESARKANKLVLARHKDVEQY